MADTSTVREWAKSIGFEWRSAYGHWQKKITTDSSPPLIMETEELGFFFKLTQKAAAEELRKVPQVDVGLESYLWKRIDELEERPQVTNP